MAIFLVTTEVGHEILTENFGVNLCFFVRFQENIIRQYRKYDFKITTKVQIERD
jgi:hypothetical protein